MLQIQLYHIRLFLLNRSKLYVSWQTWLQLEDVTVSRFWGQHAVFILLLKLGIFCTCHFYWSFQSNLISRIKFRIIVNSKGSDVSSLKKLNKTRDTPPSAKDLSMNIHWTAPVQVKFFLYSPVYNISHQSYYKNASETLLTT